MQWLLPICALMMCRSHCFAGHCLHLPLPGIHVGVPDEGGARQHCPQAPQVRPFLLSVLLPLRGTFVRPFSINAPRIVRAAVCSYAGSSSGWASVLTASSLREWSCLDIKISACASKFPRIDLLCRAHLKSFLSPDMPRFWCRLNTFIILTWLINGTGFSLYYSIRTFIDQVKLFKVFPK